jgi:hypothetical protein
MGLTLSNYNVKNNSNYFGTTTKDASNSSDLNQAGAVLTIITQTVIGKFGINYEKRQ